MEQIIQAVVQGGVGMGVLFLVANQVWKRYQASIDGQISAMKTTIETLQKEKDAMQEHFNHRLQEMHETSTEAINNNTYVLRELQQLLKQNIH